MICTCNKCKKDKELINFYHYYDDNNKPIKINYTCKECRRIKHKENYLPKLEKLNDGYKRCTSCKEVLELKNFRPNGKYKQSRCSDCETKLSRPKQLYDKYGITIEEYNKLLLDQNYVCKICNNKNENRNLCVDHCHSTGKVRGLLCDQCNTGLGKFKDSVDLLKESINYLINNS